MIWLKDARTQNAGRATAIAATAVLMAGCSSGVGGIGGLAPGPLPYQHSNAFGGGGYSESLIGPDRYRIEVKGPATTSRARMENIAATRAAEIGRENHLGYFKIENVEHTTRCQTVTPGPRAPAGTSGPKTYAYAITTADVSYTKQPPDPSYRDSRKSFQELRAALDSDPAPTDPAVSAAAQCPR